MYSIDEANLYETTAALTVLLSHVYNLPLSSPTPDLPLVQWITNQSTNSLSSQYSLHAYTQKEPLSYSLIAIRCLQPAQGDLHSVEHMYWNMINYYPSYSSYMGMY